MSKEPIDYPDIAKKVTGSIVQEKHDREILICGTGLGIAISANEVRGIRAAT